MIVNGTVIREDGRDALAAGAALPGRVLRGGAGVSYPIISADSHITEPPNTYLDYIDREVARPGAAPRVRRQGRRRLPDRRAVDRPVPLGLVAAAGKPAEEIRIAGVRFEELHRGGWDPDARMADQRRDGVAAEIIYPTVGMVLCNHPDFDYKKACFDAYNRWIAEYCGAHPDAAARLRPDRDALARGGHRGPAARSRRSGCAAS